MWGEHLKNFKKGWTNAQSAINSNNEIIPNLDFQQKRFLGGLAKRFINFNTVIKKEEKEKVTLIKRTEKGALYIHGKSTPCYSGNLILNKTTGIFSVVFEKTKEIVFSDSIFIKRISEDRSKVGWIFGSTGNISRDFSPYTVPAPPVQIKRFEYQSITKSSLDQKSAYRRNKKYYSKVFKELYETGRPVKLGTQFCCKQCGKAYYTGSLRDANDSPAVALKDGEAKVGSFYIVNENSKIIRKVTNPSHSNGQYVKEQDLEQYSKSAIIRFNNLDITDYDYDYRIIYYPIVCFPQFSSSSYYSSTGLKKKEIKHAIKDGGYSVSDFSKKNDYFYTSYGLLIGSYLSFFNQFNPIEKKLQTKITQSVTKRERYQWTTYSMHSPGQSGGINMPGGTGFAPFNFITGGFSKSTYGCFTSESTGDAIVVNHSNLNHDLLDRGGDLHPNGAGGFSYSTGSSFAHRIKGFCDYELVYDNWFEYVTEDSAAPAGGSFLTTSDSSNDLSDDELADAGITPKRETKEEEETFEQKIMPQNYDPFEITYVTNKNYVGIEIDTYMPQVLSARLQYELIIDNDESTYRLECPQGNDSELDWHKLKFVDNDGSGGATNSGSGYSYINGNGFGADDIKGEAFYFYQKYKTATVVNSQDYSFPVTFAAGVGKKYYYEDTIDSPSNMIKSSDINGNGGGGSFGDSNFETDDISLFKDVNVRLQAAYGKYSFLAVGYDSGWAQSVFNKYIFTKLVSSSGEEYELPDSDDSSGGGGSGFNTGDLDSNEIDYITEIDPEAIKDLFITMTDEEKEEAYEKYMEKYFPKSTVTLRVGREGKASLGCIPGLTDQYHAPVSVGRASVNADRPWELVKSYKKDGYYYETYSLNMRNYLNNDQFYNISSEDYHNPYKINSDFANSNGGVDTSEVDKKKKSKIFSPVFKNANIPGCYRIVFSELQRVSKSYSEYKMALGMGKGKLYTTYNPNLNFIRPWAGNIVTVFGCCPVRAKNDYFIFNHKNATTPWAAVENTPDMQNRFFGSGFTYLNHIGEGVYPHPDGNKFIIVAPWVTDAYEALSGIELTLSSDFTNFANRKMTTGFNLPCDSALIAVYNINGPLVSFQNIFSKDVESSKYTVNKGVLPIIKALWSPSLATQKNSVIEMALFMIETQCMIEGPVYYFSKSKNKAPPGFESGFKGYKSRGLMVAIKFKNSNKFNTYVVKNTNFLDYFEKQNEKRDKVNLRKAYDAIPQNMREEKGYYWECEEAFGPYEISSPFAFETQLAAKMSFSVRVGDDLAVLFLLAYDIDKWPANIDSDNPSNDKKFPKIRKSEEYTFKSAYGSFAFNKSGVITRQNFQNHRLKNCLCPLVTSKYKSDSALKKEGLKYFNNNPGIIVHNSYTQHSDGYDNIPIYILNENANQDITRGVVRLVRWRSIEWEQPETTTRNKFIEVKKDRDGEIITETYIGAVAQCAITTTNPIDDTINPYFVGTTSALVLFYKKKTQTTAGVSVKNLFIPKQMCWLEEQIDDTEYKYKEHLINIASIGMFDVLVLEKNTTEKKKKNEKNAKMIEVFVVPVITTDNQTYLAVTRDFLFWQIAGKVGSGQMQHLVAEFMENINDESKSK